MRPKSKTVQWLLRLTTYLLLNLILLTGGIALALFCSGWLGDVGTGMTASSIVGFLFAYQLKIDRQFDETRQIYDEFGLVGITPLRSHRDLYLYEFQRCTTQFDILGEALSRFYDDLGRELLPQLDARNVRMRVLLMDPTSPHVALRQREDASPQRTDLEAEITKAAHAYLDLKLKNLQIRYFQCSPTLSYQRIDNRIFAGPYFVGIPSGQQPALLLRVDEPLAVSYQQHFEYIWRSASRPVEDHVAT